MSYPIMSTSVPWSIVKSGFKKTPHFNTVVQKPAAGRGISTFSLMPYATWDFEVDLAYVTGGEAVGGSVLQSFLSCYMQTCGGAGFFLFTDPNDSAVSLGQGTALNVTAGAAAPMTQTGDGASTQFQLARLIGSGVDVMQNVSVTTLQVNGVTKALGTDYSISATGVVTFTTAPAISATISWAGTFQYLCRFTDDTLKDLSRVSKNSGGVLWDCASIQFEGIFI